MTFPTTALPVAVEIAPGADPTASPGTWTWSDVTDQVRLADRISIVTGRQNEASQVDPSRCTLTLDNTSGDFTPRNPAGQWYGSLARNTPLRVAIRPAEDAFGRTSASGWGSADSGQAWSMYGAGGSVLTSDFTVSGGLGSQSVPTAGGYRTAWLPDLSVLDCRVLLSGVSLPFTNVTGGSVEPGNILLRAQSTTEYYLARVEITTAEAVVCKLYDPSGSLLASATVSGLTHSSSQTLEVLAEVVGNTLSMKVWASSGSEPSGWHVTATDDSLSLPGGVGVRTGVASGNTNTLPVVASYDSVTVWVDRFCGFVSSWPPRWDKSGNDATVPIQADGVLRRLGKGTPPARSALRRALTAAGPIAYWPGEDGSAATQLASAIAGHPPMLVSGTAEFVPVDDLTGFTVIRRYGTSALVDLSSGARLSVSVPSTVTAATTSAWTVAVRADVDPDLIATDFVILDWTTPGGAYARWQLTFNVAAGLVFLYGYDSSGTSSTITSTNSILGLGDFSVSAAQNGSSIDVTLRAGFDETASVSGTLTAPTSLASNTTGTTATGQVPVGHFTIWDNADGPPLLGLATDEYGQTIYGVALSAILEPAHSRLDRLCGEDGTTISIPSVDEESATRMGWQAAGTPLDLYRQCETADQGVLYELGFGLGYLPRSSRYNRAVTLTVDFDAGQVAEPPEPVDDDQTLLNRVTARRIDGSSAVAEDSDSIAANGPYDGAVDLNLSSDSRLLDYASWLAHVRATDVMRWPLITVNLARSPELIDSVLSCRVQSRMVVDNPPAQVAGDDIDVLIEGYAETLGTYEWLVSFNTSPAKVWDVAVTDEDQRVAADGSTLAAALTSTGTSLLLSSTDANGAWTEDSDDFPLPMLIGGERVTASAIGSTAVDAFGRTASSGWGSADSGQAWTTSGGSASDYSVASGTGRHSQGSVGTFRSSLIDIGAVDARLTVDVSVPVMPAGNGITHWSVVRAADLSNYYAAMLTVAVGGAVSIDLRKRVAGSLSSSLASFTVSGTHTAGTTWRVVLDVAGTTLRAKAWRPSADTDPGWQVTATDSGLTSGTSAGVLSRLETGNTNTTPVVITYDSLEVPMPQTVTLSARSVNGVVNAWPVGTEVDVWEPAVVAL